MIVRERRPGDLPGCVEALRAVHVTDGYPTHRPDDPAGWLSPAGCAAAWVAVDEGGDVLGHVCVVDRLDEPTLAAVAGVPVEDLAGVSRLFVSPAARGRGSGLGTALLSAVQAWAGQERRQLALDVVDDGGPAVSLYERLGWRLVAHGDADWVTPAGHRHRLRLYLAPDGSPPT